MNSRNFYIDEFMNDMAEAVNTIPEESNPEPEETEEEAPIDESQELDVQKAVVEALAEDKVKLEKEIADLKKTIEGQNEKIAAQEEKIAEQAGTIGKLEQEVAEERQKTTASLETSENEKAAREAEKSALEEIKEAFTKERKSLEDEIEKLRNKEFDLQERNPNALALLDREPELPDRFPGETRDQVLEVLKEGLKLAEEQGRLRRMQILESVILTNEPNGTLARKRTELQQLFEKNGHLVTGEVIDELKRQGISYKNGEAFLMPAEILSRAF